MVHHKVQRGETLSSIAKSHNITVDALKQNNGNLANLRPGMVLVIGNSEQIVRRSSNRPIRKFNLKIQSS